MNQIKKLSILALGLLFIGTSCSVEKRVHTAGYHIDWNNTNDRVHQKDVIIRDKDKAIHAFAMSNETSIPSMKAVSFGKTAAFTPKATDKKEVFTEKASAYSKKEKAITSQNIEALKEQSTSFIQENKTDEIMISAEEEDAAASSKSQLVALLLVIFVGALGIHRFYLGYTTIGIIQLLTGGGCGIWALIDLIRIVTGDLKPRRGRYNPKL